MRAPVSKNIGKHGETSTYAECNYRGAALLLTQRVDLGCVGVYRMLGGAARLWPYMVLSIELFMLLGHKAKADLITEQQVRSDCVPVCGYFNHGRAT